MRRTLFACAVMMFTTAHADPLPVRDLNPWLSGFELPPALAATTAGTQLEAELAIANITLDQSSPAESLQVDAELQRWQLSLSRPFGNYKVKLELPLLKISGGQLDGFIESWHRTFGLPNGNRNQVPRHRLLMQHATAGSVDYLQQASTQGLGDVTLRVGRSLGTASGLLWLSIKFPTGGNSLGSGATDIALSYALSQALTSRINTYQQLSASLLGKGDRLREQQHSLVWSGSLGMNARLTTHWSAILQFDAHTKAFDSDLRVLGNAMQLSFGPRYESRHWQTSLIVTEDIAVDTAPDVQFQVDVVHRFE